MALNTRIQTRRDTAANWEAKNPVLLDGEMIIVTTNAGDTRFKIGDGTKTYTQLPFQDETLYNALSGKADAVELDSKADIADIVQSDWSINDETNLAYVKNRPFYSETVATVLVENATVEITKAGGRVLDPFTIEIVEGGTYVVTWNGTEYECVGYNAEGVLCIGNATIAGMPYGDNEPFLIGTSSGMAMVFSSEAGTHVISIAEIRENVVKVSEKYLPIEEGVVFENASVMLPSSAPWNSVTYGNGKFVAVAANSTTAAYSEDGVTWTAATLPSSAYWYSVTYGNGRFVAVAANSTTAAYSEDGITWTAATLPSSADWRSVTYGNGKFVAVAANSTTAAYSEDGVTWTQTTLPRSAWWNSVTYDNGKFVAVAQSSTTAAYSEDGITWHDELKGLFQDGEDITTQVAEVLGVPTDAEKEAWNAKADATELSTLQSELSNKSDSDHTHSNVTPITTAGDGAAYTATVPDITALTAGVSFTMIPHTASTSQTATLNVNGLGAKALRRPLSVNNTTTVAPSTTNWLYASKPVRVMYNGTYWIVMDMPRPNAPDIYGTVAIENGGTGATDAATALTNLGITATADELNYMDGVTSNVQTQISQLSSEIADKEDSGTASALINRTTNVNAADTNYTTLMARGEKLLDATTFDAVTDWSEHLVNGAVAWRYE